MKPNIKGITCCMTTTAAHRIISHTLTAVILTQHGCQDALKLDAEGHLHHLFAVSVFA